MFPFSPLLFKNHFNNNKIFTMTIKTILLISQHERCTRILEGIQSATRRRDSSAEYIKNGTLAMSYHSKQFAKYSAIRERLILSYSAALEKLVKPVIDKVMA